MMYDLACPTTEEFDPDSQERMARGVEAEDAIVNRLRQVGPKVTPPFQVIEGQSRFSVKDRDGTVLITGKIDGRIKWDDGPSCIFEVKSGRSFERVNRLMDLDDSHWTRHALDQLLVYLLAFNEPVGVLVINKPGRMPLFLEVQLTDHLERAESFLFDARVAIDAAKVYDVPGYEHLIPKHTTDIGECRRCPHFKQACHPPHLDAGEGFQIITDPDLIEAAEQREKFEAAASAYEQADKRVKDALRGVERAMLGPFEVEGKWSPRKVTKIPDEVKAQYTTVEEQGTFRLKINRIGGTDAAEDPPI